MAINQELGRWGEKIASEYLSKKGYSILGMNIRTPYGEIDILASLDQVMVFIEVKTRTNTLFGFPENAITKRKLTHMEQSAQYYMDELDFHGTWQWDAVSIQRRPSSKPEILHFENIIS
jgi:putative endonuclease